MCSRVADRSFFGTWVYGSSQAGILAGRPALLGTGLDCLTVTRQSTYSADAPQFSRFPRRYEQPYWVIGRSGFQLFSHGEGQPLSVVHDRNSRSQKSLARGLAAVTITITVATLVGGCSSGDKASTNAPTSSSKSTSTLASTSNSGSEPASSTSSTTSATTETPRTPTSSSGGTSSAEQQVIDRYVGYWDARFAANSGTPNPEDPALAGVRRRSSTCGREG